MYYAVEMCGNEYLLNGSIGRDVRTRKFRHLHLRHFVRLPHHYHSLENSRTFQDLALKFPGLSTGPNPFSRTFQDLEIVPPKIQDFPGAWEPCFSARSKICSYNVLMAEHKCDNMAYNSNLPSYPAKNCHLITQQKKTNVP